MIKQVTKTPKEVDKLSPDYYWFKLRTYFAMNGIRREEIAAVLGVTPATVSNYNKDASKVTIESYCKLLRAYHIIAIRENSRTNLSDKNSHYCVKLP